MSSSTEDILVDEISNVNLTLRNENFEVWRLEMMCKLKMKSIEHFEDLTEKSKIKNECLKKQLDDVNSKMEKVRDNVVSLDRIINSLDETLADLEVQNKKKEFSIHQLKNSFELQLFIRKELWQKNEEYLNNIPEVKCMKIAESEFKNTKLEYDKLLINKENLVDTIAKAKVKNDEKKNGIIIKFAVIYGEMLSLTKKEKQSTTLLRKLEAEYSDKLNIKNSLLLSQQKKPDKVSFWTHSICPLDLLKKDTNHEEFKGNENHKVAKDIIKPNFDHSKHENILCLPKLDSKHLKSNEPSKSVTFCLPSDELCEDIQNTNNDDLNTFKNENTKVIESIIQNSEIYSNSLFMKNNSVVNESNYKSSQNVTTEQTTLNSDNNKRQINKDNDFLSKKSKTDENQLNVEFIKPNNSILNEMNSNKNINHIESNLNQNLEKIEKSTTKTTINHRIDAHESSNNHNLPKHSNYSELAEQNLINNTSNTMFDVLQHKKKSLHEQSKVLSELFWNDIGEQQSECDSNESFRNFDMAEYFDDYNISQSSNLQLNFINAHNSDPNSMSGYSFQETNVKNADESEMFNSLINNR